MNDDLVLLSVAAPFRSGMNSHLWALRGCHRRNTTGSRIYARCTLTAERLSQQ